MDADDDAWSAEIRCLPATPAPDPLVLEEDTAERLLAGDLRLDQAPFRDAAPSILATQGDAVPIPLTKPGRPPNPSAGAADAAGASTHAQGPRPAGEPGTTAMTGAVKDDRCRASKARKGVGKQMAAAAVDALAAATGGGDKRATHCQRSQPGGPGTRGQGEQAKSGGYGRGQASGPPPSSGGGNPEPGRPPEAGPHRR